MRFLAAKSITIITKRTILPNIPYLAWRLLDLELLKIALVFVPLNLLVLKSKFQNMLSIFYADTTDITKFVNRIANFGWFKASM